MTNPVPRNVFKIRPSPTELIDLGTLLVRARGKIADYNAWTCNALAVDSRGRSVHPKDKRAVRFCSSGALDSVGSDSSTTYLAECLLDNVVTFVFYKRYSFILDANDDGGRTTKVHEQILECFDIAIIIATEADEQPLVLPPVGIQPSDDFHLRLDTIQAGTMPPMEKIREMASLAFKQDKKDPNCLHRMSATIISTEMVATKALIEERSAHD